MILNIAAIVITVAAAAIVLLKLVDWDEWKANFKDNGTDCPEWADADYWEDSKV